MGLVHLSFVKHRNVTADGGIGHLEKCDDLCPLNQHRRSADRHAADSQKSFLHGEGCDFHLAIKTQTQPQHPSRSALSTSRCFPSPGSEDVTRPLRGEPIGMLGELVPVFGVSKPIGVIEPLGGTGILMSSGEPGTHFSGSPGILILVASLL